jgi:hypothetical protein
MSFENATQVAAGETASEPLARVAAKPTQGNRRPVRSEDPWQEARRPSCDTAGRTQCGEVLFHIEP